MPFLSALLSHENKRTLGQQSLYEKSPRQQCDGKCVSLSVELKHFCTTAGSLWGLRRRRRSKLNSLWEILVGWICQSVWLFWGGRHRCTFRHFKLLLWCEVVVFTWHGVYVEKGKKENYKWYILGLMRKSLWYWIFKQILLNLPLNKIKKMYKHIIEFYHNNHSHVLK